MIKRIAENLVHALADQFPAILIIGPRQCGKTTLARHFLEGEYFDLERPSDQDMGSRDYDVTESIKAVSGQSLLSGAWE